MSETKFQLGQLVSTPGALRAMAECTKGEQVVTNLIARHVSGDWGEIAEGDEGLNDKALESGDRLLSVYSVTNEESGQPVKLWVITEADRSATTVLLPEEY